MGTRGPVPKRTAERRRRNAGQEVDTVARPEPVPVPELDPEWHPIARDWYASLETSGQSSFFEPSDWQAARFVAEVMTKNLEAGKFSSVLFASVWSAMGDLLTTEADRRRVRIEIERAEPEKPASVSALADYRKRVGA